MVQGKYKKAYVMRMLKKHVPKIFTVKDIQKLDINKTFIFLRSARDYDLVKVIGFRGMTIYEQK